MKEEKTKSKKTSKLKKHDKRVKKWVGWLCLAPLLSIAAFFITEIAKISCLMMLLLSQTPKECPISPQLVKSIDACLSKPFHYIAQGSTSQVFSSQDESIVIKIPLKKKSTSKYSGYFPFIGPLSSYRKRLKEKLKFAKACVNTYALVRDESAILYYHFSGKSRIKGMVKLGNKEFDLSQEDYFIQKKAIVAEDYLKNLINSNQLDQACASISDLLNFAISFCQQGILMVDLQFTSNFGFIDGLPVRIDIEHICIQESWKKNYKPHLLEQLKDFERWLKDNAPMSVFLHFEREMKKRELKL